MTRGVAQAGVRGQILECSATLKILPSESDYPSQDRPSRASDPKNWTRGRLGCPGPAGRVWAAAAPATPARRGLGAATVNVTRDSLGVHGLTRRRGGARPLALAGPAILHDDRWPAAAAGAWAVTRHGPVTCHAGLRSAGEFRGRVPGLRLDSVITESPLIRWTRMDGSDGWIMIGKQTRVTQARRHGGFKF